MDAEDGQGLLGPRHTQHLQDSTREGAGSPGGSEGPSRACPRTCPTPARVRVASLGRSPRESPGPPSGASAPSPWSPEGRGAAPCRCHLRHRSRSSRAGWARRGRTSVPGWGRQPPSGGGPGPPGRQRQQSLPSQTGSPAPPLPDPRTPALARSTREDHAAEAQRSRRPAPFLLTRPAGSSRAAAAARRRRGFQRSRRIRESSLGFYPRLREPPPGGGREPARAILGLVVLGPLRPVPPSIEKPAVVPSSPVLLSLLGSSLLLTDKCWSARSSPGPPLLTRNQ